MRLNNPFSQKATVMPRFIIRKTKAKGTQPGSLIFIGEQKQEKVRIRLMSFGSDELAEKECSSLQEALKEIGKKDMCWINIDGLHDSGLIQELGAVFNIDPLLLEDMINTDQRSKFEEEPDHFIVISKLLTYFKENMRISSEQVSMIAGKGYLISLQEKVGTHFEPVRNRIRKSRNRQRVTKPDYLAYALLDCMIDNYMEIIEEIGERLETIDEVIIQDPGKELIAELYRHRTELNFLRKTLNPVKELSLAMQRSDSLTFTPNLKDYISDLKDHIVMSLETIDSYQTMIMDQMSMYHSQVSNRANEIMKTLTIFASIFIPLTFVAGIYGMNFKVLPELNWQYGYLFFWCLIVILGGVLLLYFRKKKWL